MLLSSISLIEINELEINHWGGLPNNNGSQLILNVNASHRQDSISPGDGFQTGI